MPVTGGRDGRSAGSAGVVIGAAIGVAMALLVATAFLAPGLGWAEVRRVEAVGTVAVDPSERGRLGLRDKAIQAALREAVFRIARELLLEAEAPDDSASSLDKVLHSGMVRYTTRFRILEDQGERPALFSDNPSVATEYVVIVEVDVDVDRVEAQLLDSELIARPESSGERRKVVIEAYGLDQYPAYQAFAELVSAAAAGGPAQAVSFERGRALLAVEVEAPFGPLELLDELERLAPEGLEIEPIQIGGETLSVTVTWHPPPPEDTDGEASGGAD
jgi:hypothetical protein